MQNLSQNISNLNSWDVAASKWYGNLSSVVRAVKGTLSLAVFTLISPIALVAPDWEKRKLSVAGEDLFKGVLGIVPFVSQVGFRALNKSTAISRFEEHISEMTLLNIQDEIAKIKEQKTSTSQDKIYLKLLETKLSDSKAEITAKAEPLNLEELYGVISEFEKEPNLTDNESFELSVFKDVFETKFGAEKKEYQNRIKDFTKNMSDKQIFDDIQMGESTQNKSAKVCWTISILKKILEQRTGLSWDAISFKDYPSYANLMKEANEYKERIKGIVIEQTMDVLVADIRVAQTVSKPTLEEVWTLQVLQEVVAEHLTLKEVVDQIQLIREKQVLSPLDMWNLELLGTELAARHSYRSQAKVMFLEDENLINSYQDLINYRQYVEGLTAEELPKWKKNIQLEEIDKRFNYHSEVRKALVNDSLEELVEYRENVQKLTAKELPEWKKKIQLEEIDSRLYVINRFRDGLLGTLASIANTSTEDQMINFLNGRLQDLDVSPLPDWKKNIERDVIRQKLEELGGAEEF